MAKKYLDDSGMSYFWGKLKAYFQPKLVSGTNIKTINNESLLGSGNISTVSTIAQGVAFTTVSLTGNTDYDIDVSSVISGTPRLLLVEGYTPRTTWNTTLIIKKIDISSKTVYVRTIGATAQIYGLWLCAIY